MHVAGMPHWPGIRPPQVVGWEQPPHWRRRRSRRGSARRTWRPQVAGVHVATQVLGVAGAGLVGAAGAAVERAAAAVALHAAVGPERGAGGGHAHGGAAADARHAGAAAGVGPGAGAALEGAAAAVARGAAVVAERGAGRRRARGAADARRAAAAAGLPGGTAPAVDDAAARILHGPAAPRRTHRGGVRASAVHAGVGESERAGRAPRGARRGVVAAGARGGPPCPRPDPPRPGPALADARARRAGGDDDATSKPKNPPVAHSCNVSDTTPGPQQGTRRNAPSPACRRVGLQRICWCRRCTSTIVPVCSTPASSAQRKEARSNLAVAARVAAALRGVAEVDREDAPRSEGAELGRARGAVPVLVAPEAEGGPGRVLGRDPPVAVRVELRERDEAVRGPLAAPEHGGRAEELRPVVDGAVAVAIEGEPRRRGGGPVGDHALRGGEVEGAERGGEGDGGAVEGEDEGGRARARGRGVDHGAGGPAPVALAVELAGHEPGLHAGRVAGQRAGAREAGMDRIAGDVFAGARRAAAAGAAAAVAVGGGGGAAAAGPGAAPDDVGGAAAERGEGTGGEHREGGGERTVCHGMGPPGERAGSPGRYSNGCACSRIPRLCRILRASVPPGSGSCAAPCRALARGRARAAGWARMRPPRLP